MGWFGVLRPSIELTYIVNKCHVNLWALPTLLPGRRLFYFDMGLEIAAQSQPVTSITVVLPFEPEEAKWPDKRRSIAQDLFDVLLDPEVASLVFGEPITNISATGNIRTLTLSGRTSLELGRINSRGVKREEDSPRRADLSVWTIPLVDPIPPGGHRYVRLRYRMFSPGTVWSWKRMLLGRAGAQVEFRISDIRESPHIGDERAYWDRLVPVYSVNFFLIVTRRFRPRIASPALHYVRRLEGGAWRKYMSGMSYASLNRLLVHYWRYPPGLGQSIVPLLAEQVNSGHDRHSTSPPITAEEPFRAYLDLGYDVAAPGWVAFVRNTMAVLTGVTIVNLVPIIGARLSGWWPNLDWPKIIFGASVVGVLALLSALTKVFGLFKNRARKPRLFARTLERALLRWLRRSD